MKKLNYPALGGDTQSRITAQLGALVLACSCAPIVFAQDNAGADAQIGSIEEVVVTAIRKSLSEARDVKRDSSQFVDAIVSADIGKLPDTTVAESLGRISGVQIDRGIGQGSDISIRGLRQNVVLYNGRQIWDSAGRGSDGPDQLGTSTYGLLGTVPAAMISRLEVEKLSGADQIDGALGGAVNIVSRKPLDEPGQQIAGSMSLSNAELGGDGEEFFGMYSNTFADDTMGLLVSLVRSEGSNTEHALGTFSGYALADTVGLANRLFDSSGNQVSSDPNGDSISALIHLDPRPWQIEEDRERTGLNVIFQYSPSDDLELTFDHYLTKLESDRDRRWLGYYAGFGDYNDVVFSDNEVIVAGVVTRPTHTNVEFADIRSDIQSTAVSGAWQASDAVSVSAELSYTASEGTYDQQFLRLQSLNPDNVVFDLRNGDFGEFQFQNDFTDASNLSLPIMFFQEFVDETDDLSARFDVDWELDSEVFSSFEFGARIQNLETTKSHLNVDIRGVSGVTDASDLVAAGFLEVFSNDDYLPGEFTGVPRDYLTFLEASLNGGGIAGCESMAQFYSAAEVAQCAAGTDGGAALNNFKIEEEFLSVYAKANFETQWGNTPVSGNFGVRVIDRELTSTGKQELDGTLSDISFTRSDTEVLPSAAVKFDVSNDLLVRVGAAKVVAFPETTALNNGVRLFRDVNNPTGNGSGGSPDLDPFSAVQFDTSVEWYFAEESMLSAGLFYKDIDTYIVSETTLESHGGEDFFVLREVNGEGAKIKGLEVSYQQPLNFFPGLGTVLTYSFIDGETPLIDATGRKLSFPGLSENNVNAVVFYETDDFNMRVAYNWRDDYLNSIGAGDTGVFNDAYEDLSFTARYNVNDNITLGFEATNLLDSQLTTYNAVPEALRTNAIYGKNYKLSVTANF